MATNQSCGYDWELLRTKALERDGHACRNCNDTPADDAELMAHHVIPDGAGGPDTLENIVTLCRRCHNTIHRICNKEETAPLSKLDGVTLPTREKGILGQRDCAILRTLAEGRATPSYLERQTDYTRQAIQGRLTVDNMNQNNTNTDAIDTGNLPDAWRKKAEAHETQPGIIDLSYAHALRDCAGDLEKSLQATDHD